MRTARTIGIKADGKEEILHPKSTAIQKQLADFNDYAANGIPKGLAAVEFQTSDGRVRTLRDGITSAVKSAEEKAEAKKKSREKWLADQKKAQEAKAKEEAAERQKRIDAANASKEAAKKKLLGVSDKK